MTSMTAKEINEAAAGTAAQMESIMKWYIAESPHGIIYAQDALRALSDRYKSFCSIAAEEPDAKPLLGLLRALKACYAEKILGAAYSLFFSSRAVPHSIDATAS